MNLIKRVAFLLGSLLISSPLIWASTPSKWPVLIDIDFSDVDFGSSKPSALICDYILDSYPAGKQTTYWVSLKSREAWIGADKMYAVIFDYKSSEHLGQGHVYHRLHCKGIWREEAKPYSVNCMDVAPNSTIRVGAAIASKQCIVNNS